MIIFLLGHLFFLHLNGRSSPSGYVGSHNKLSFVPYYVLKDIYDLFLIFLFFIISFGISSLFVEPDLFLEANPLVSPAHIVPEWYLLPFYGVLRSIPSKIFGVVFIFSLLLDFYFLSLIGRRSNPNVKNYLQIFS